MDPEASPISAMAAMGHFSVAADWVLRHQVPVEAIVVDGKALVPYLEDRLARAQARGAGRNRGGIVMVQMNRQNQVVPFNDEIEAQEIPRVLSRLANAGRRSPRP